MRVAIVGAGISGLLAAQKLARAGHKVTLFEKAARAGGRLATKSVEGQPTDIGTQYFTASTQEFTKIAADWQSAGVVRKWSEGFSIAEEFPAAVPKLDGISRSIAVGGMSRLAAHLAEEAEAAGVILRCEVTLTALPMEGSEWLLRSADHLEARADQLLLTPPLPQSLQLLSNGHIALPETIRQRLASVQYESCFAAIVVLDGPSAIPAPGGLRMQPDSALAWMADNAQKLAGVKATTVTLLSSAEFTRVHLNDDPEAVGALMVEAAGKWLGSAVKSVSVHRWRYALPTNPLKERCLWLPDLQLAFAGDFCAGASVECAALSGRAAARAMMV
jgi:hypothetical protein